MAYDTDLSDEQWALIAPLLPAANLGGRPRTTKVVISGNLAQKFKVHPGLAALGGRAHLRLDLRLPSSNHRLRTPRLQQQSYDPVGCIKPDVKSDLGEKWVAHHHQIGYSKRAKVGSRECDLEILRGRGWQ